MTSKLKPVKRGFVAASLFVAAAWAVLATWASALARRETGGLTLCIVLGLVVGGALNATGMIMLSRAASTPPVSHALRAELLLTPGLAVLAFLAGHDRDQHIWADLAHVLINSKEFIYIN